MAHERASVNRMLRMGVPPGMALDRYYLLGSSGLRISPLSLGTMNFGTSGYHAAYGKTIDDVRPIFRRYLEAGGNSIDTA
ncbi:MAG: hypothetical protein K0R01_2724, partial [Mycobacterium sp.]|nr:hypothetical protein [Mycobacterium sp.]